MKQIKSIIIMLVIFLLTGCGKSKDDLNELILGEWQYIGFYGEKADNTQGWIVVQDSPIQTTRFLSNGQYSLTTDGMIKCNGSFNFESPEKVRMNPQDCMPRIQSLETIFTLTEDSLIISNSSLTFLSTVYLKELYIKLK
jgi:hypothetical protein